MRILIVLQLLGCMFFREICWRLEDIVDFLFRNATDVPNFYPSCDWESRCYILEYKLKKVNQLLRRRRNALNKNINKGIEKYNRRLEYQRRKLNKIEGIDFKKSVKEYKKRQKGGRK